MYQGSGNQGPPLFTGRQEAKSVLLSMRKADTIEYFACAIPLHIGRLVIKTYRCEESCDYGIDGGQVSINYGASAVKCMCVGCWCYDTDAPS